MDPLATNAETLNDEWRAYDLAKAKELARPLGTFDDELALQEERQQDGAVLSHRSQRWYRAILREFDRRKVAREKEWGEEEERAREAAEERALERARTHGLRDAAATIVGAQLLKLTWNYVWLFPFGMLMFLGLDAWTPNILVRGLFFVLEALGNGISFGVIHHMVKERFDPIAAWVLTLVAFMAAHLTTDPMLTGVAVCFNEPSLCLDIFLA